MPTPTEPDPATLAPIHVVLPMRSLSGGKVRLGEALDAEEREELVLGMLLHTLEVLARWSAATRVHLVSPDPRLAAAASGSGASLDGLDLAVQVDPGRGLNAAIEAGVAAAVAEGARSVLVLPGDLPALAVEALDELTLAADAALAASDGGAIVAIAPSDARIGTNALLLMPPRVIRPRFGPDSFEVHVRAAADAEAAVQVVSDPVLGFDLDTPEDLERLEPVRLLELTSLGRAATEEVEA